MDQPPGFVNSSYPHHVCHLKRALYGLKQAPRAWLDQFSHFLLHIGFFCSHADSSLYNPHCPLGTIILLLYVDDNIGTSNNGNLLYRLIFKLGKEFSMKDLGPFNYFLGIEVSTFPGGLFLS